MFSILPTQPKKKLKNGADAFQVLYIMQFIVAITIALPTYINSSFLSKYASDQLVGLLYTGSSVLTLLFMVVMPRILTRFGNYATMFGVAVASTLLTLALAFLDLPFAIYALFVVYAALTSVILFTMDVFIEAHSSDSHTGSIRGIFLTIANFAFVISPFIAGTILTNGDYWKIFMLATITMASLLFLLLLNFRDFKDPTYDRIPFWNTLREIFCSCRRDVKLVYITSMALRFFYAWMVIYSPLYLHNTIGFTWNEIGIMFTVMLLPFILFEIPAGRIADKKWGEKELLAIGFIMTGVTTAFLSFINSTDIWVWTAALFATRIGASIVEIMSESYFFKKVDSTDTHIIGFFRNARPLAYIIAPMIASGVLFFLSLQYIFLVGGIIVIAVGLPATLMLKDTK
jgi:MFS family permease